MQTIHFTCPHCKNLMAVGDNLLGRNVRCPHCKQVVQAPATNPAAAPVMPAPVVAPQPAPPPPQDFPQFQLPDQSAEGHESIFGEVHDDDVFGRAPQKPVMPPSEPRGAPPMAPQQNPFAPAPQQNPFAPAAPQNPFMPAPPGLERTNFELPPAQQPAYQPPAPPAPAYAPPQQPAYAPPPYSPPAPAPAPQQPFAWNEPTVSEVQQAPNPWASEPTAPIAPASPPVYPQQQWQPPPQAPAYQPQPSAPANPGYGAPPAPVNNNPWGNQAPMVMPEYTPQVEQAPQPSTPRENPLRRDMRRAPTATGKAPANPMMWLLLVWALAATAGLLFMMFKGGGGSSEPAFMSIPDFFGEFDKADRKKTSYGSVKVPGVDTPLPAELCVAMGKRIQVGQHLAVEPVAIEKRKVFTFEQQAGSEPTKSRTEPQPVHVLRMKIKNTSADLYFCPTDPAFNRRPRSNEAKPYTGMEIGTQRTYGGPFYWPPSKANVQREFIEGQEKDNVPLGPGEEREYVVSTIVGEPVDRTVAANKEGPFIWRVHLRRGVVSCEDKSGKPRDVSVTAVIGVVFKPFDIQNKVEVN